MRFSPVDTSELSAPERWGARRLSIRMLACGHKKPAPVVPMPGENPVSAAWIARNVRTTPSPPAFLEPSGACLRGYGLRSDGSMRRRASRAAHGRRCGGSSRRTRRRPLLAFCRPRRHLLAASGHQGPSAFAELQVIGLLRKVGPVERYEFGMLCFRSKVKAYLSWGTCTDVATWLTRS